MAAMLQVLKRGVSGEAGAVGVIQMMRIMKIMAAGTLVSGALLGALRGANSLEVCYTVWVLSSLLRAPFPPAVCSIHAAR